MRKFLFAAAMGLSALAATPALAQAYQGTPPPPEGYYDESYAGPDEWAAEGKEGGNGYEGADEQPAYEQGYEDQGGYQQQAYVEGRRRYRPGDYYEGDARREGTTYRPRRCRGTTGAILGGIAGALIGGDIGGRQGRYRYRRSGTGTVIGAGLGAVVGSEIDRSNCEDRRRYDR